MIRARLIWVSEQDSSRVSCVKTTTEVGHSVESRLKHHMFHVAKSFKFHV